MLRAWKIGLENCGPEHQASREAIRGPLNSTVPKDAPACRIVEFARNRLLSQAAVPLPAGGFTAGNCLTFFIGRNSERFYVFLPLAGAGIIGAGACRRKLVHRYIFPAPGQVWNPLGRKAKAVWQPPGKKTTTEKLLPTGGGKR